MLTVDVLMETTIILNTRWLDKWLAVATGNTATHCDGKVARLFISWGFWSRHHQKLINNLATLPSYQVAVFLVVITSYSSSVEKDGSLHQNAHPQKVLTF